MQTLPNADQIMRTYIEFGYELDPEVQMELLNLTTGEELVEAYAQRFELYPLAHDAAMDKGWI